MFFPGLTIIASILVSFPVLLVVLLVMATISPSPDIVEKEVVREIKKVETVEVPVEVEKEVIREVEVIRRVEVPIEVEKEVIREVEVIKEIEVPVERVKEVIREVRVPVEATLTVTKVPTFTPPPGRFFIRGKETDGPEEWKDLVGERRWKTGHSAKALASSWEESEGFPEEVQEVFNRSGHPQLHDLKFIRGYPEHKVPLPGGSSASQSDIFVIAESGSERIVISVEGKVKESFGQYVEDWIADAPSTSGKPVRFGYLKERLGIEDSGLEGIRYQLMHRTASALIEAERFGVETAVMLVHSFSQEDEHIGDYQAFVELFGASGGVNTVSYAGNRNGIDLYLAWVRGDKRFLEK